MLTYLTIIGSISVATFTVQFLAYRTYKKAQITVEVCAPERGTEEVYVC